MLDDGFKSDRYSAILGNLRDNGYLDNKDVELLLKAFIASQRIDFADISEEKARIVSGALIDNYMRMASDWKLQ